MANNPKVANGGGSTPPVPYALAELETWGAAVLYAGSGITAFAHTIPNATVQGAVASALAGLGTLLLIVRRVYP